jgi:nucleoside 2-deoxyribosyltransferase
MKIYIAGSWKHKHGIEMLTDLLRKNNHEVLSFIEKNQEIGYPEGMPFENWLNTHDADQVFDFDTISAMTSDLVIYYGASGKDAAAEVGLAYAKGIPVIGLWSKGEDFGLMRKLFTDLCYDYYEVIDFVNRYQKVLDSAYDSIQF